MSKIFRTNQEIDDDIEQEKIIQIMPCTSKMYAVYEDMDDKNKELLCPIIFLSLTKAGIVQFHDFSTDGYMMECATNTSNFKELRYTDE